MERSCRLGSREVTRRELCTQTVAPNNSESVSGSGRAFRPRCTRKLDRVAGRDKWYAGAAVINGKLVGPPLGIRSITVTSDGGALLANVHVGGIPRSVDGGATWRPTIDVDSDVYEVLAHPSRAGVVVAAAAAGLCISSDGGATWEVEQAGLHESYCSAVGFARDHVVVAAAADHFAAQSALYQRDLSLALIAHPLKRTLQLPQNQQESEGLVFSLD